MFVSACAFSCVVQSGWEVVDRPPVYIFVIDFFFPREGSSGQCSVFVSVSVVRLRV